MSVTYTKRYHSMTTAPNAGQVRSRVRRAHNKAPLWHKLIPAGLMIIGSILLGNALIPILASELSSPTTLKAAGLSLNSSDAVAIREYLLPTPKPTPVVIADTLDYTNLANWFTPSQAAELGPAQTKQYKLSIPTVDIQDAEVTIGGTNLDKGLIQYPGTADPGQYGSPVIFGHSVLRQFYNPSISNPRRYFSIFSKIMTLEPGDLVYLEYDNVRYTYKVTGKTEVNPEDTYILEQQHSSRQLKLVTCVPEGTTLRRGIVNAELEAVE